MRIPVVLPVARIRIDDEGALHVLVDGHPYAEDADLQRGDLPRLLDEITTDFQTPVRVEVTEADGRTYSDIATPLAREPSAPIEPAASGSTASGLSGAGFRPGEQVAVAYVLLHETADAQGAAVVRLPPAAISNRPGAMLLFGLDSRVAALIEAPA